jgi:ribosome-binding factor A
MSLRTRRVSELLKNLAAQFLERESDRTSLITVTGTTVSSDLRNANINITVFPTDKESAALDFVKRKRGDFRNYVQSKAKLKYIPFFDFEIDKGEKNRQRIDALSNS